MAKDQLCGSQLFSVILQLLIPDAANDPQTPKAKELIGLIHLPTELLAEILGHYIAVQPLIEQHFPNPYGDRYREAYQQFLPRRSVARTRRLMELMVPASAQTLLQPSPCRLLNKLDHIALDVNTIVREAYIFEVRLHFLPVLYLNREDITATGLNGFGASFSYLWSAPKFRLELFLMAHGAPKLVLTQNELDLLAPFLQRFKNATECFVNWFDRSCFHRFVTQTWTRDRTSRSSFSNPEVEKMLQSVPSLKKMRVMEAPQRYKLLTGRWTTSANEFNLEAIKEQMKKNMRQKALLKQ